MSRAENLPGILELADELGIHAVGLQDVLVRLVGVDGLRARLHDEQLAAVAVLGPFDVHGHAVVVLDVEGHPAELHDLFAVEGPFALPAGFDVHRLRRGTTLIRVDHLAVLGAERRVHDGPLPAA